MEFNELIKERFSCRALTDRTVEPEKLTRILEAGNYAPTAVNNQPFRIWQVESSESVEKIKSVTNYTFGARTFLIIGADRDEAWVRTSDKRNFADVDAAIVATHIMLAIHNEGLRSTWVGHFDSPKLKELFPEMADYDLIALFPIGYPAEKAAPAARHTQRKSLVSLVKII